MAEYNFTIATEDDGSQWVELEHYTAMQQRAIDYAKVLNQFNKLVDAWTTTEAFEKIVALKQCAAQQKRAADCFYCGENKEPAKDIICQDCVNLLKSQRLTQTFGRLRPGENYAQS